MIRDYITVADVRVQELGERSKTRRIDGVNNEGYARATYGGEGKGVCAVHNTKQNATAAGNVVALYALAYTQREGRSLGYKWEV